MVIIGVTNIGDTECRQLNKAATVEMTTDAAKRKSSCSNEVDDQEVAVDLLGLNKSSTVSQCLKILLYQSCPVITSYFLKMGGTFITLLFAARFTPNYEYNGDSSVLIAGVNLANLYANVSCLSILIGMSSAVETLGSQHNGAGNYREVGIVFQRSCCVLMTLAVPVLCSWFFAYDLFTSFGVEHDVSTVIAGYLEIRALSVPLDVINFSYEKYLMSIGVMQPSMWANITFNVALVVFNSIFIIGLKCRFRFLAVSWVLSAGCLFVVQIGMSMKYEEVHRTLQPWFVNWDCFRKWGEFFTLGLPGTIMLCSDWWAFEALTLMAARLGTAEVAAQAMIIQIVALSFMIPTGVGVATASLVGNCIGAEERELARTVSRSAVCLTAFLGAGVVLLIYFGGTVFISLFTSNDQVVNVANSAVPVVAVFEMFDFLQCVFGGILRGTGKQHIGAVLGVLTFYALGLPLAWWLCFPIGLGIKGLVLGVALATVLQVLLFSVIIFGYESYLYQKLETRGRSDSPSIGGRIRSMVEIFPSLQSSSLFELEFKQLGLEDPDDGRSEKNTYSYPTSVLDEYCEELDGNKSFQL